MFRSRDNGRFRSKRGETPSMFIARIIKKLEDGGANIWGYLQDEMEGPVRKPVIPVIPDIYCGQWVAIRGEKVVAHSKDLKDLPLKDKNTCCIYVPEGFIT